ncbi:MAG TPA: hypothetical protein VJB94_05255 [Candidatus Nanoarchaeia archaeon]|nr:hypothetical protein [Candidatus Nanoarchaeia archaeon]
MPSLAKIVLDSKRIKSPGFATTLKRNIESIVVHRNGQPTIVKVISRSGSLELGYDPLVVSKKDVQLAITRVGYSGSFSFE